MTARTMPAPDVWGCAMLVQVRVESQWMDWVQTFGTVGDAREAMG